LCVVFEARVINLCDHDIATIFFAHGQVTQSQTTRLVA
jgi:hypothetical protein